MPHVIGIDLGTTHSLAATLYDGKPHVLVNERGNRLTPSVVTFRSATEAVVGELARQQSVIDYRRTAQHVKRKMGQEHALTIGDRAFSPAEISALVLRKVLVGARGYLGDAPREAVITVPAYFSHHQRLATKQAGEMAGLRVIKLLNEPTAAALAYAQARPGDANLLVLDLGGGTLDVTLMECRDRVHRVIATGGSNFLGGLDFDHRLVAHLASVFRQRHGIDVLADPVAHQQILLAAERAKIDLSSTASTRVQVPFLAQGPDGFCHLDVEVTRETFEDLVVDLIHSVRQVVLETFALAGRPVQWVTRVLLAGGATRMPFVARLVEELVNRRPLCEFNPDEVVAMGAALQAGILAGTLEGPEFYDATPFWLGVEDDGGRFVPVIPANTPYPTQRSRIFTTALDGQARLDVHVVQQESSHPEVPLLALGRFSLEGLPPGPKGGLRIEVGFDIDRDGLLAVSARDLDHGVGGAMVVAALPAADSGPPAAKLDVAVI